MATTTKPQRGVRAARGVRRRGAMAVLIALLLIVFLVAVVFSVDIAYMHMAKAELRAATDAAARAAAEALSRTQDLAAARQAAKDIAAANAVAGDSLLLADEDIVFGNAVRQANGAWVFTADATPINSARVLGRRTQGSASGAVNLLFAKVLGTGYYEPTQTATTVRLDRDICLVVDRSSSMKLFVDETAPTMSGSDPRFCEAPDSVQSRWFALATAVDVFLEELDNTPQTEYVGLVSYASNYSSCGFSNHVTDVNQAVTSDTSLVQSAMNSISASVFNGNTNIRKGIDSGVNVLTDPTTTRTFAAKTMVLFTDGHATQGGSPVNGAHAAAAAGITIHTVTFGDGANQVDMLAVAEATGGNHYHAPDAATLRQIFREIALTLPIVYTE